MNEKIKKLLKSQEISSDNLIIRIIFIAEDENVYEAVGVLVKGEEKKIRIGFNAKNDVVVDFLDIDIENILKIEKISLNKIKTLF